MLNRPVRLAHAKRNPGYAVVTTLELSGQSSVVKTHSTPALTVVAKASGLVVSGGPYTFLSSNTSVATVAPTGVVSGLSPGTTDITVQMTNALGATITSNVLTITVAAQVPTSSALSPAITWTANVGDSIDFDAVTYDQLGGTIVGAPGSFSSSDPTNAPIDSATGVMSANGAATGVTITFTPTGYAGAASTAVGNVSAVAGPTLMRTISANDYANDAAFRSHIRSTIGVSMASTTLTNAVTASASPQNIVVGSTAHMYLPDNGVPAVGTAGGSGSGNGTDLFIDTGGNQERVTVLAIIDAVTISAICTKNHAAGVAVTSAYKGVGANTLYGDFGDGSNTDLITLDAVNLWRGKKTFRQRFPRGTATTSMLQHYLDPAVWGSALTTGIWIVQYQRYDSINQNPANVPFWWTATPSGGISYKVLNCSFSNYNGRTDDTWQTQTVASNLSNHSTSSNPTVGSTSAGTFSSYNGGHVGTGPAWAAPTPVSDLQWYTLVILHQPLNSISFRQAHWFGKDDGSQLAKQMDMIFTLSSAYQSSPGLPVINRVSICGDNRNQLGPPEGDQFINRGDTKLYLPNGMTPPSGLNLEP